MQILQELSEDALWLYIMSAFCTRAIIVPVGHMTVQLVAGYLNGASIISEAKWELSVTKWENVFHA